MAAVFQTSRGAAETSRGFAWGSGGQTEPDTKATEGTTMTGKADFNAEEWSTVLEGPPLAGMIVITAQRGGTLRESISMAKVYGEARQQHSSDGLLEEIVSAQPE